MKLKPIIFVFSLLFFLEITLGLLILRSAKPKAIDTVEVNALVHSALDNWAALKSGSFTDMPASSYQYSILSADDTLLYANASNLSASVNQAIANGDTLADIENKGKLILNNPTTKNQNLVGRQLFILLLTSAFLYFFLFLLYIHHLNQRLLRPFEDLKAFALRVAGGNLDFPLPMDRLNIFGAFTESFDLMRSELKKARDQERAAEQSKRELVAQLSHDIKTPVSSIKAIAELMAVTGASKKQNQQLSIIQDKTDQINELVSNLFHATLEELQELSVSPHPIESTVLSDMIKASDYAQMAKTDPIPECLLSFDRLRLQQVFDNLFENSYKYAGTPLHIRFLLSDQYLILRLYDQGPGVSEEELPMVSKKFYRGKNAAGKSGAGLGLYISRYLISQMAGTMDFENSYPGFCVLIGLKLA